MRMKFLAPPVCARLDSKHAGVARAVFLGRASGMRALRAAVSGGSVLSGVRRSQNWTRGTAGGSVLCAGSCWMFADGGEAFEELASQQ